MRNPESLSRAELLCKLPLDEQQREIASWTDDERNALAFDWSFWGRPQQFAPTHRPWDNWLILAGRGFGKTKAGAEWVRSLMCGPTPLARGRGEHIAIIAETAADARDVMVGDGKPLSDPSASSGLLQVHPKAFRPTYIASKRRLTWPNGAIATLYNATEPDQLRGPQHSHAWLDELCKWRYQQDTWDMLEFGLRLGAYPQKAITSTPKPTLLLKQIMKDEGTVITRGSTSDNLGNLAAGFIKRIYNKFAGTRLGRQELDAEVLEDLEGALWKRSQIDATRIRLLQLPPLRRIVVAIDPNASSEEHSNEAGIVAVGIDDADPPHAYVLDDVSGVYSPDEWAKEAVSLYRARQADRIVAERNNGGEMVEHTLRSIDFSIPYRSVWASKGKFTRAEPVSALYEQGRVHHVGSFAQLEDQMCAFTTDFYRNAMGYSPDRMDALVWAITDLLVEGEGRKAAFIGV
jgi:phage terminase large subunit-like protein